MALYTVLDRTNQVMVEQPFAWDGVTEVTLNDGWRLVLQADAPNELGYHNPFLERATLAGNTSMLRARVSDALAANNVYLSIQAPTPGQVTTQVRRLTQQNQNIIRLLINAVQAIDPEG